MSEKRTEKFRHKSITSEIYCSDAQYLAELICVRMASKRNEKLPPKFWSLPAWKLTYQKQLLAANNLLKVFSFQAILKGLELKTSQWIYSLWAKNLNEIIAKEEDALAREKKKLEKMSKIEEKTETNQPEIISKPFGGNSKLKGLD